jgi:hypothetical protein
VRLREHSYVLFDILWIHLEDWSIIDEETHHALLSYELSVYENYFK